MRRQNNFTSDLPAIILDNEKDFDEFAKHQRPGVIFIQRHTLRSSPTFCFLTCPGCGESGHMTLYLPSHPKPPSPSWLNLATYMKARGHVRTATPQPLPPLQATPTPPAP